MSAGGEVVGIRSFVSDIKNFPDPETGGINSDNH